MDPNFLASPELAEAGEGHVRLWQLGSVGYDKVDVRSLAAHGIPTANCPGFTSSRSLAEQSLMLAMMVMRSYPALAAAVEAGTLAGTTGRQLAGRTLLIIGLGSSGRELARRAVAFGMKVLAIGHRDPDQDLVPRYGLTWVGGPDQLDWALARADVVSLHVPLNAETRHILDARRLGLMKDGAVVVNVARGGLIDEVALAAEIRSGHLFGAGLDVVDGEPAGPDHPLRNVPPRHHPPHVAGATDATARRRARFAALNVSRLAYGLEPMNRVDLLRRRLTRAATRRGRRGPTEGQVGGTMCRTRYGPTRHVNPRATNVVESSPSIGRRAGQGPSPSRRPATWKTATSRMPVLASTWAGRCPAGTGIERLSGPASPSAADPFRRLDRGTRARRRDGDGEVDRFGRARRSPRSHAFAHAARRSRARSRRGGRVIERSRRDRDADVPRLTDISHVGASLVAQVAVPSLRRQPRERLGLEPAEHRVELARIDGIEPAAECGAVIDARGARRAARTPTGRRRRAGR